VTWGGYYSNDTAVIKRYYISSCLEIPRKSGKTLRYFVGVLYGTGFIDLVSKIADIFSKV